MLAVEFVRRGYHVVGVEPAEATLDVARRRPGGDGVTWVHGRANDVPSSVADLVVMTGQVAQYFIDDDWTRVLHDVAEPRNNRAGSKVRTDHLRMLTARATTRIASTSEIADSNIMPNLAQRLSGITSVGLNAVALVKDV